MKGYVMGNDLIIIFRRILGKKKCKILENSVITDGGFASAPG